MNFKLDFLCKFSTQWVIIGSLVCLFIHLKIPALAQSQSELPTPNSQIDSLVPKKNVNLEPSTINFIFNYYEQDGNHSAVTGGIGTEHLDDKAGMIIVNVPIDSSYTMNVDFGMNMYTSASSDRINSITSASGEDIHGFLNINVDKKTTAQLNYGISAGGAIESDYASFSFGGYRTHTSLDKNRTWTFGGKVFLDRWQLYFPDELRGFAAEYPGTDKRRSVNLSGVFTQIINPRLQLSIASDLIAQDGLLATPFHRVYLAPDTTVTFEVLPDFRIKHPTAIRLHYFIGDWAISRFYARYYWDSFGIHAGTFNLSFPLKIWDAVVFTPFYRFHTQSAARYFQPFNQHDFSSIYHTSDFDLSAFQSHKYGLAARIQPLYGIGRFKIRRLTMFKYIELRYANYQRSDGLSAFSVSLDLGFEVK
jgi:hypothetical protein